MKTKYLFRSAFAVILSSVILSSCRDIRTNEFASSRDRLFDNGWKFLRDSISGAEVPGFDDSQWRDLDLPHDWSMDDLPGEDSDSQIGPFSKDSPGGSSTGHVIGGTSWYRKHFSTDGKNAGKIHVLTFDGVYMESEVWLNGHHVGYHPYGYTAFRYDITEYLNPPGEENILAVRVSNTGANSRWYSGSGIYRHVWLTVLDPVHIDDWGIFIHTEEVEEASARVMLEAVLVNRNETDTEAEVLVEIIDEAGYVVSSNISDAALPGKGKTEIKQSFDIPERHLWSPSSPYLYRARITITVNGVMTDRTRCHLGIRTVTVSTEEGLLINGENVLLKGACMHHDNGLLGAAAFNRSEFRRVEIMKANGYNAIRTSHNPPSRAFLDECDRLGMLLIDEAFDMWTVSKRPMDYSRFFMDWHESDLKSMLLRDRNHPSIIIWSIGNEIPERADTSGIRIASELIGILRNIDPTRPVTNAICDFWDHRGMDWDRTAPAFQLLDIGGYNYQWKKYLDDHSKYPDRIMMGTESIPMEALENWEMVKENPWIIGDFVWTGMDYLGEAGIGHTVNIEEDESTGFAMPWPWYVAWCGDIDICGNKKPQSYFRDVVWGKSHLEMAVQAPVPEGKKEHISYWGWPDEYRSWNWPGMEGRLMQVRVYSTYPSIRLELNENLIGEQSTGNTSVHTFVFDVPYEAGKLTAIAGSGSEELERKELTTSGSPAKLHLAPERSEVWAGRNEVVYIRIEVRDAHGQLVPDAGVPVSFTVKGAAELIAAGNADPAGMESVKDNVCTTFRGKAQLIIRSIGSAGEIEILATSPGMKSGTARILARL